MPQYVYQCKVCQEGFERQLKIAERETPTAEPCPSCGETAITMLLGGNHAFMSPEALGRKKPPEEWRDFLRRLKKKNPDGFIRDR